MNPYRIIVWGPGNLGSIGIREVLKRPELELAGVLAWSESKDGVDAGELVGFPAAGVRVTTNKEEILSMDADCVLHSPLPPAVDTAEMDADVIRLLESGKNVISATAYHFPERRAGDLLERLEAACKKGGASLHGSGIHPSFLVERLAVTLTGLMTEIEHLRIQEVVDNSGGHNSANSLSVAGFGQSPPYFDEGNPVFDILGRYYRESIEAAAKELWGVYLDRIETRFSPVYADETIETPVITIPKGTAKTVIHSYDGYIGDQLRITNEEYWYIGRENCPIEGVESQAHHRITIEGKPCSVRFNMDIKASILRDLDVREDDPTPSIYNATMVPMIQAIPIVCAAPPGMVYQSVFSHYADDFRRLAR